MALAPEWIGQNRIVEKFMELWHDNYDSNTVASDAVYCVLSVEQCGPDSTGE